MEVRMNVKETIDKLFEYKVKELKLNSGDITPLQQYVLDSHIRGIQKIVDEWVKQNEQ